MGFRNKNLNLENLLPPAQIDPRQRPKKQMTFADTLVHKMKEMASPVTGPIQHWMNDPVQQANTSLLLGGPIGMAKVWHGSPHKFNKFDMSKIGTGEGAQAYGHGLYFADKKGVAQSYADTLGGGGRKILPETRRALKGIDNLGFSSSSEAMGNIRRHPDWMQRWDLDPERDKTALTAIRKQLSIEAPSSNMYKVDLPDDSIAKMIDWDKPVKDQPALKKIIEDDWGYSLDNFTDGKDFYNQAINEATTLSDATDRADIASKLLKKRGIAGIKYLDQVSRKGGKGSHNYVVFDDNLPKILEMNNLPVTDLPFGGK